MSYRPVLLRALLAAALGACAPPPACPAPVAPAATAGVRVFLPPPERCVEPPARPAWSPAFEDTAPLAVSVKPGGIALEAGGAKAGRVLLAIAEAAKEPLRVQGYGASVRIYAHVAGLGKDALVAAVAAAAGLVAERAEGEVPAFLDPDEAARRAWERRMAVRFMPIETRLIPARHAVESAAVLARLLLPCGGDIVAAPRHGHLVVRGTATVLSSMEALIEALEAAKPAPISLELPSAPRWIHPRPPTPEGPWCDGIAALPAPDLPRGQLSARGAAAGALLREVARGRGRDAVIGCGGDQAVFFRGSADLDRIAPLLGLAPLAGVDGIAFGAQAMRRRASLAVAGEAPLQVRGIPVPGGAVEELAAVADHLLAPRGRAVGYTPASMLLVAGSEREVELAESLVRAWAAPARPRSQPERRGAGREGPSSDR